MKIRIIFSVVLATALVVAGLATYCYAHVAESLRVDEQEIMRGLVAQVGEEVNTAARGLAADAETVANMPPLQKAVQAKSREQLAALLGDGYGVLHKRYGFAVGQINSVDNTVLYRFHEPDVHGDDFVKSRKIIVAVHSSKEPQSGIEIGTSGMRVRGAAPVMSDGALAGSIEFGMELQPLLETLKTRTNADFAMVVDRRLVPVPSGGHEANVFGNLRGDSGTSWPIVGKLHDLGRVAPVKEPRYDVTRLDGVPVATATVPLLDYSGSEIGIIIAAKPFGADARALSHLSTSLVTGALIAEIAIMGIILVLFRGVVLRPVATIARAVNGVVDGTAVDLPRPGTVPELNGLIAAVKRLKDKHAPSAAKA